uniref:Uncharacterized protein n=1 Tax=Physcomitrium patens TaxID=3218 RepID=A0A2K1KIE9_PHYPA|nr:hypothetical protein PHYPA_007224 [Physcomitrium patens]
MGIDAKVIQAGLFNTTSTAQERREMLEETMRRGSGVIGTGVPSERTCLEVHKADLGLRLALGCEI